MRVLRAPGEEAADGGAPLVSMVVAFHHVYTNHANPAASFAPRQRRGASGTDRKCMWPHLLGRYQLELWVWRQAFGFPDSPIYGLRHLAHAFVQQLAPHLESWLVDPDAVRTTFDDVPVPSRVWVQGVGRRVHDDEIVHVHQPTCVMRSPDAQRAKQISSDVG